MNKPKSQWGKKGEAARLWWHSGYKKRKRCECCHKRKGLVVHHKNRAKADNRHKNLETLCRACHRIEHSKEITAA